MLGEYKVLIVFIVGMFTVLLTIVINAPSEHERRMELIQEKEALLRLHTSVEIQETQKFIDSMDIKINTELK